ncbi:Hypothetical protein SMAX5B_014068 [Scophthalmus maximus]|uniref:Uncharacterized protein n=1 Tax=Scophthalmus maximus TaxID=52904 RepID=A0A2U9BGA3_SCOMX|nr:Hypothetical protein SMAX5B_014068 [Scophthalmus maximus]
MCETTTSYIRRRSAAAALDSPHLSGSPLISPEVTSSVRRSPGRKSPHQSGSQLRPHLSGEQLLSSETRRASTATPGQVQG